MREVLRGEELPAQWQKYSLKTQAEMMAGRDSVRAEAIRYWADEGVVFLNKQFGMKLGFSTHVDCDKLEIMLNAFLPGKDKPIFSVVEPAKYFVSQLTFTKLMLIAG